MLFRLAIVLTLGLAALSAQAQTDSLSADPNALPRGNAYPARVGDQPQKYVALDVAGKMGSYQRYRFFTNQNIKFRYRPDGRKYNGKIVAVTDSSFGFATENFMTLRPDVVHYRIDDVKKVYLTRQIPFVTAGAFMLPLAGVVFFLADVVNGSRGEGHLTANPRALVTTGALIGVGGVCYKLSFPRYSINKNHRLRIMQTY